MLLKQEYRNYYNKLCCIVKYGEIKGIHLNLVTMNSVVLNCQM